MCIVNEVIPKQYTSHTHYLHINVIKYQSIFTRCAVDRMQIIFHRLYYYMYYRPPVILYIGNVFSFDHHFDTPSLSIFWELYSNSNNNTHRSVCYCCRYCLDTKKSAEMVWWSRNIGSITNGCIQLWYKLNKLFSASLYTGEARMTRSQLQSIFLIWSYNFMFMVDIAQAYTAILKQNQKQQQKLCYTWVHKLGVGVNFFCIFVFVFFAVSATIFLD